MKHNEGMSANDQWKIEAKRIWKQYKVSWRIKETEEAIGTIKTYWN